MKETSQTDRAAYEAAREAFEALPAQDKVAFVFEATFGAVGEALAETGRQVAHAMESVFDEAHRADEPADDPGPASTKTSAKPKSSSTKRASSSKTAGKKTTSSKKKTTSRKKKDEES